METAVKDPRVEQGHCSFCPGNETPAEVRVIDRTGTERLICTECEWIVANLNWRAFNEKVMQYQMNGETKPRWMPRRIWRIKNQRLEYRAASWTVAFATLVGRGLTYQRSDRKCDHK